MVETTLGISIGTKSIGIGVFQRGELIDWQVKTFKGRWSDHKQKIIVSMIMNLCDHFNVRQLALKVVSPLRCSSIVLELTTVLKSSAMEKNIPLACFTLQDLKRMVSTSKHRPMNEISEFLSEKYPQLRKVYLKECNNLKPYYLKMFEAVAAGYLLEKGL